MLTLSINGHSVEAEAGSVLFDSAEAFGIQVPTSCRKQGKCKECVVEVAEGMDALSERTAAEAHLRGGFRLACQARVIGEGLRCHTMRRANMRIERHAYGLPLRGGDRPGGL